MDQLDQLKNVLLGYGKVAIAYSGGCDSHFLYEVARQTLGRDQVLAVLCQGAMMSQEDIEDARALLGDGQYVIVQVDVLKVDAFLHNTRQRCYECKKMIMSEVIKQAHHQGFTYVLDGRNEDDNDVYRPGIRACEELGILSPLSMVHMRKDTIRQYSKELNIRTYNKPSNACLASRFPYDTLLSVEKLKLVSDAESLLHQIGIFHARVRVHERIARIEVEKKDFQKVLDHQEIIDEMKKLGFDYITLDLEGIMSGRYDR